MMHSWIVPPIPPNIPWNMLPTPVAEFLTACPVHSITLDAASPRLPTTFLSKSPIPFNVLWIALPIVL